MESMSLLVVKGIDYSDHITMSSWTVNSSDCGSQWTDANGISHQKIYRQKISGSFTIYFDDVDDYSQFVQILQSERGTEGEISLTVFVNNLATTKTGNFTVTIQPANLLPYYGTKEHDGFSVSIEER